MPRGLEENSTNKYEFHKGHRKERKQSMFSKCWICITVLAAIALLILLTAIATVIAYTLPEQREWSDENFTIIRRRQWGAKLNTEHFVPLRLPVQHVVIMHTATPACLTENICKSRVQQIQDFHMTRLKYDDIGYNFLVGGDGSVYVGRGWNDRGAFALGYNSLSMGVAFIGEFKDVLPTKEQMQVGQLLVQKGVQLGKIADDYKLLGLRQISESESPGDAFYNVVKTWPHWEEIQQ